ncbi:MAG: hypothetical protein J3K34DRAFT_426927 [Monoraphidium minutum]|nr:MAG: hypothetical protein J3K34DRAFT_426927 [Monoraphidium minutum]
MDVDSLARVCAFLAADDLLHCGRVCRGWRAAVAGDACEPAWRALCAAHGYRCRPGAGAARLQFRAAHEQILKDRRLKRRVDLMAARSAVANLERELAVLRERRRGEADANRLKRSEAAAVAHLVQAHAAMQGWQLGVVRAHLERVAQPQPIQGEWRLRNLEQAIKESDVHLGVLQRSVRAKELQLAAQQRRLAAMTGS